MCGISGIISHQVEEEGLKKSASTLSHRGPDDQGIYISNNSHIGLAHRRLSLIDLSKTGHQPMTVQHLTIIFNGEIYNYRELQKELESQGAQFRSSSDTEVILWAYLFWGAACLSKFKGMFAFAILDEKKNELFLARDRFGIKPLFYSFQNNNFYFGSEVKAILAFDSFKRKIQASSVALFLANRFVSDNQTMWKDIYKLPAAHYMKINTQDLSYQVEEYWSILNTKAEVHTKEVQEQFEFLLKNSLKQHLRSDVPIGAFLSGGLDSSTTVLLMQKELQYDTKAFSIGFNGWNESEHQYAQMVADETGANLKTLLLEKIDFEVMPKLMVHYDDPIADISILPTYFVSQLASQNVKAVISGEGADEFLGGYSWQKPENFYTENQFFSKWPSKLFPNTQKEMKKHYIQAMSMGLYDNKELKKCLQNEFLAEMPKDVFGHLDKLMQPELSRLKQIQLLDMHRFMGELVLVKVDRASMANSLEVRVPFLDHELVEYLFQLPEDAYMKSGVQKPLLQNILRNRLPEKILNRPKQGFVGPDKFYKDFNLYKEALTHGRLIQDEVISSSYLQKLFFLKDHWRLWKLFVLEHWWRAWM
ncbi:MAG: asparagine synthase (glutamine-hydrolyzing) [Chitinophagales bacterium]|nr:asparagine synthase (glutamine-hydrolyzing) [Chitinophagales bacterium]